MTTKYAVAITAVTERADLFCECTDSLLAQVDQPPDLILVNEDVRPQAPAEMRGRISDWLVESDRHHEIRVSEPNIGMGRGMLWCFERAAELGFEFVLYTQEDWRVVRPLPIKRCLELMVQHGLHHVRFNKRKTMPSMHADTDHPWMKIQVKFPYNVVTVDGVEGHEQTFCIAPHWYTQTSLWRVQEALPGLRHAASMSDAETANQFVKHFNEYMNHTRHNLPREKWNDQQLRLERLRTFIWGPIAEPKFIEHAGTHRGTGHIKDHMARYGARGD